MELKWFEQRCFALGQASPKFGHGKGLVGVAFEVELYQSIFERWKNLSELRLIANYALVKLPPLPVYIKELTLVGSAPMYCSRFILTTTGSFLDLATIFFRCLHGHR